MTEDEFKAALLLLGYHVQRICVTEYSGRASFKYKITPSLAIGDTHIYVPLAARFTGFDGALKNVVNAIITRGITND